MSEPITKLALRWARYDYDQYLVEESIKALLDGKKVYFASEACRDRGIKTLQDLLRASHPARGTSEEFSNPDSKLIHDGIEE